MRSDLPPPAPIEAKVVAATGVTWIFSVVLAVLNSLQADPDLLGGMPFWLQTFLLVTIPPLTTFLAAYQAPHTPRSDDATDLGPVGE